MIDLHMHSLFSDGVLIPSEVVSRCLAVGYTGIAITDHADPSNLEYMVERMVHVCGQLHGKVGLEVHPGVEITHVPPELIARMAKAREAAGDDKKKMKELQEAEGIKIAIELIKQVLDIPGVKGVHVMAIEWESALEPIVKGAGLYPRPTFADA